MKLKHDGKADHLLVLMIMRKLLHVMDQEPGGAAALLEYLRWCRDGVDMSQESRALLAKTLPVPPTDTVQKVVIAALEPDGKGGIIFHDPEEHDA